MLAMLHAPPGYGKSKLLHWLRSYFEEVWLMEHGVHFVILAPMNTMANNVGGETMHAWGEVPFVADGKKVGRKNAAAAIDLNSMHWKCEARLII